ncbi:peptidoglycan DD-metalloendopeptidase family protein [Flavobacterium sp. j3]|uniref:Peptidoglycan DD-metalloendopeptidase family protein n=1 Tax=Flavobacterium aureirubrum TaxID=3133147 RepID=A0ABU9N0W0_9FLAO
MENFTEVLSKINTAKVIAPQIDYSDYVALDLSIDNEELAQSNLQNAKEYELYIQRFLDRNKAKIAFGGYLETRNLYQRSTVFKNLNSEERNIHIGLDLWINQTASIHAALDGTIHSFQNNTALGDYGPTIILAHHLEGFTFYSLYGHLSVDSITNKNVGDVIKQGQQIGNLGLPPINGDYAPHLHFQIILNIESNFGDYPGVCNAGKLDFYSNNCPNPNILLKIDNNT